MTEAPRSRRLRRGAIAGAIESWLPHDLEGADDVRRRIALRLAAALDAPDLPAHAVPRIANALTALIAAIQGDDASAGDLDVKALRRLLREVVR